MTEASPDEWMFYRGNEISFPVPQGVRIPIYVIGDSHVLILHQVCPSVFKASDADVADIFESKSAYAVGTEGHDEYLKESIRKIPEGSVILLSFGEIDCRHYVPKLAKEQRRSIGDLVDEVFHRYMDNCVRVLSQKFRVSILGPYICIDDHEHTNSYSDIFSAKVLLNIILHKACHRNGMAFVPIFQHSLNEEWDLKSKGTYFNDTSHLGPCMIPVIFKALKDFKWKGFDV